MSKGNAKIEGMVGDLGMTDIQYNIVLSIFFIPYILLEVPSNVLLKKFKRPSTYIGILVISWGTVMTFTGIVKNFTGLMICRVLLGIAEVCSQSPKQSLTSQHNTRSNLR